jgi:hypothetical protein
MVMLLAPKKTVVVTKHPNTKPDAGADKAAKASPPQPAESTTEGSK